MDLYEKGDTEEDVFSRLDHTGQESGMVSLYFEHDRKDLLELFFETLR